MTYDTDSKERTVTPVKKQISFVGDRGDYRQELLDSKRLREENAPVRANSNMPKKSEELLMEAEDLLSTQKRLRDSGVIPPIRDATKYPDRPLASVRNIGRREVCDPYVEHRIDEEWQLRNDLNNCIEEEDEPTRYHGVTEEKVPQVCKVSMKGLYGRFKSGGVICYGLMDTGAGINIISRRMLESLRRRNRFKVPDMSDEIPDKILVQVANSGFWTLTSRVEMILDLEG